MKVRKCPYCGKRISYVSAYSCRRKGQYVCSRCGKESRVYVNRKIYLLFAVFVSISIAIMCGWIFAGLASNPLGILFVTIPLVIFAMITPEFVKLEPLKKYKKSMEARKAGIEYSDNLISSELDDKNFSASFKKSQKEELNVSRAKPLSNDNFSNTTDDKFELNTDLFNKIRDDRNKERIRLQNQDSKENAVSDTSYFERPEKTSNSNSTNYVSIINDKSEKHISTKQPLRKIHSETKKSYESNINNNRKHFISSDSNENSEKRKLDGNKYSANRKF